jgi:hypothetical protein
MSRLGFRPHFTHEFDAAPDKVQEWLVEHLIQKAPDFEIRSFSGFVCLRLPPADRHFWSPRLNLSFDPHETGCTRIEGVYGPNANVWSLLVYGYMILGSLALFGACLGFAQASLDKPAWGLWVLWISLGLGLGLWFVAQVGRRLGAAQTERLHHLFEGVLGPTADPR